MPKKAAYRELARCPLVCLCSAGAIPWPPMSS